MTISLNGEPREIAPGATVARVLGLLDLPSDARGVAVAVDAQVVPRAAWEQTSLADGAQVEVLTAMQGG